MKTIYRSLLSLLLVLTIVLQIVPAAVFATEDDNDTRSLDELMLTDEASLVPAEAVCDEILFEDTSLREENVKHFRMKDGSYRAVIYDTPVHYLDDEGNWQEYDNTLHTIDRSGEATGYRVENGDSVRLFAADADSEVLLSVSKGEYALTISPVLTPDAERPVEPEPTVEVMGGADDAADAALDAEDKNDAETTDAVASDNTEQEILENAETAVATTAPETQQRETTSAGITVDPKDEPLVSAEVLTVAAPAEEEITDTFFAQAQPEKLYSALEYEDLLDGSTLRYENYANSIKESIIIPARQEEYTYSFRLQVTGLTPELLDDGSISLTNAAGKTIYTIPAPYMIDAKDKTSYEAFYTLEEANGGWLLTITADAEWMNDKDRAYPVVLDPTVTETAASSDDISAATVYNGGTAPSGVLCVGKTSDTGNTRSYFHINRLPYLPAGCELTNATFGVYQTSFTGSGSMDIGLHALTSANKYGNAINGLASTEIWKAWASGLTWTYVNNGHSATHNPQFVDRHTASSATSGSYTDWDITTLAASWYDSAQEEDASKEFKRYQANLGFALIATNESTGTACANYAGLSSNRDRRPRIMIEYRNVRGIESDYTYQTASIGNAGTAYIGDFAMQTTLVVPLVSDPSDTMPLSVSLVYNSSLNGCYFSGYYKDVHTADFDTMKIGIGWKLSLQETIVPLSLDETDYLIYTDGDGTEHYYIHSGNGIYIEEGENTRLTISGSSAQYTLSDEYGNKKIFTYGYLTEVRDAYGNALYYCYNDTEYSSGSSAWKPSSASDSHYISYVYRQNKNCAAEKILVLGYSGDFLSTIIPKCNYESDDSKASRRITLLRQPASANSSYTNLTGIEYPGNRLAQYTYYGSSAGFYRNNKLSSAYDAEANYGISFDYSYNGKTRDIFEYVQNNDTRVYGTMLRGYKRSHLLAVYRDYGKDQVAALDANENPIDGDDYLTFKVLNRMGRTISAYTTDSTEQRILGSSAAAYTSGGERKANNLLAASAYTAQPGVKLMRNGGAEYSGDYWNSAATVANVAYRGEHSFQINGNELYQLFRLYPGKTYTFSGYIKINGTTASNGGVSLAFQESISSTEVRDIMNSPYLQTTTAAIDGGWQRVSLAYAPQREIVVRTAVLSKNLGSATAYGDCFQLEESESASSYNLLNCGSFEESDSIKPYKANEKVCGWYYVGNASLLSEGSSSPEILFGNQVLRVNGGSGAHRASQEIIVNAPAGSAFLLSGWGKANALPSSVAAMSNETNPYYGLIARLYYGETIDKSEVFYLPFDAYSSDWQQRSGIMMPSEANKDRIIKKIVVVAAYDNNANTAYFDNISLRMEPTQTYRYDDNGNPIAATQPGTGSESAAYSGVDLTSYIAANGAKYTYTYNSAHDVTSAKIGNLTTTTTYNAAGNVTSSKLTATGTSLYLQTGATATNDQNHTASVTDANGNTTQYTYDAYTGLVNSITNAKGQTTGYSNDYGSLRPTGVYRTGVVGIDYIYAEGRLATLDRKVKDGTDWKHQYYNFAYNIWGQPTTTKVGNRTLSTNTYYDYAGENTGTGGNLKQTTYGNNDSVSYFYDELDRLIRKEYTGGRYVTYTYNAEGQLAKLTYGDGANEKASYLFEYDSLGRLVRSSEADGSGTVTQRTEHIYDEYSRLKRQSWTVNNQSYSEAYTYNDGTNETGNLATMTTGTGNVLNYSYDPLKRLQKVTVKGGNTSLFSTAYAYRSIDSTRTTQQVEFRNVRLESDNSILEGKKYVYDSLGNITEIRQSTSPYNLLIAYEYDAQNQLTSEIHYNGNGEATANITVAYYYDYDAAGNLLKVEKGTVNSAGTLTKTTEQTYTYNDTDWRDLLTELNDTPIVYEGQTYDPETNEVGGSILSGNPEYYNGWNFDWQRGRELAGAEQTDGTTNTTLTYAYDADGIRTSKTYTVETQHTVTFVADGTTVKTMTVADGYTLKTSDYPTVPAKSGYTGSWNKYTEAIHANITIEAVYQEITNCIVRFVAERITLKTMTVQSGYVLKDSDYPNIPQKTGYTAVWGPHAKRITKNTTITVKYTKNGGGGGGITIPTVRPSYSDAISDLPEPIEPQDVAKPDDTTNTSDATGNIAETQATHPGQALVSTQTVTHEYLTLSGKVVRETVKVNGSVTEILDFLYDESGRPFALNYSTDGGSSFITYYYILNLQGDVVKLVTSSGSAVATYEYDAWGNVLSKSGTMADKNPLRYRGYYYDTETGFYYLQSRYYDPANRRFINADSYASTGQGFIGTNMFAYCLNNPIIYRDTSGETVEVTIGQFSYSYQRNNYKISISVTLSASAGFAEHATVSFSRDGTNLTFSVTNTDLGTKTYSLDSIFYPSVKDYGTLREKDATSFGISFGINELDFTTSQAIDDHLSLSVTVSVEDESLKYNIARAILSVTGCPSIGTGNNAAFSSAGASYLMFSVGGNLMARTLCFFI